jgi:S1-C subfamily serine protease
VPVQPGNSGGALEDEYGNVIGIVGHSVVKNSTCCSMHHRHDDGIERGDCGA